MKDRILDKIELILSVAYFIIPIFIIFLLLCYVVGLVAILIVSYTMELNLEFFTSNMILVELIIGVVFMYTLDDLINKIKK